MPNFISEDDIEQAMVQALQHVYGYDTLITLLGGNYRPVHTKAASNASQAIKSGLYR